MNPARPPLARQPRRRAPLLLFVPALAVLPGCLKRTIHITSDPPGAVVRLNDVEIGRTPVDADFTYYGDYDVRLDLDGYEPIATSRTAQAPFYEYPPLDLAADAWPTEINTDIVWHFDLTPSSQVLPADPAQAEAELLRRARETAELIK